MLNVTNNTNLILILVYSQRTPMISHITQQRITDIGDTTELTCTVLYASDFNILWIKVDKERSMEPVTFSSGSTLIIRDSRLSLRYDIDSNSYSLQVPIYILGHSTIIDNIILPTIICIFRLVISKRLMLVSIAVM